MRIGIFTDTYYPEINGVANSALQLKKELEKRGNQVYVFTVSNPKVKESESNVYRMKSVPFLLMKERRVTCSVSHKWYRLIQQLQLDVIHTQTEFMVGHIGRRAAKLFNIALVHTYHTLYEDYTHYLRVPGNQRLKGVIRNLSRICCDKADMVIAPTGKVKDMLLSYGVQSEIMVQPTGVWFDKFEKIDNSQVTAIRKRYGLDEKKHILISIGRVSQEKNLQEILRLIGNLSKKDEAVRLLIVGDGPERELLEQYVRVNGLERYVKFLGEVPWKQIQNYYALGDIFVSASTSETQGLTYMEALACGKPILVRQDACLQDILIPSVNGYAYQQEEEFERGYYDLLSAAEEDSRKRKIQDSIGYLSAAEFGRQIEEIYRNVCDSRKRSLMEGSEKYEEKKSIA